MYTLDKKKSVPSRAPIFRSADEFFHKFFMDGGQVHFDRNYLRDFIRPRSWTEDYDEQVQKYKDSAISAAWDDIKYEGYTLKIAVEIPHMTASKLRQLIKDQKLGAIKKYRKWYIYRPSLRAYIQQNAQEIDELRMRRVKAKRCS